VAFGPRITPGQPTAERDDDRNALLTGRCWGNFRIAQPVPPTPSWQTTMKFDPQKHHRRSIRMPGYDYSQPGAYFVTLVTHGRECLFGEIENSEMHLNDAGRIVWDIWNSLPARYPQIALGAAVVMPNHFHGIVTIEVGAIHELPLPLLFKSPKFLYNDR
jgi:hypothetical protein